MKFMISTGARVQPTNALYLAHVLDVKWGNSIILN